MYEPRTYRRWVKDKDLVPFNIVVKETDLHIRASSNLRRKAYKLVIKYREILEKYIAQNPVFLTSLKPLPANTNAPNIIKEMAEASQKAGVGPMASVAGAIAQFVGNELLPLSRELIIENGGDIFLSSSKNRVIAIYAGQSPLSGEIGLEINGKDTPLGISTSSGTVGHSLSYGTADAVTVISKSAILADAAATAIGNRVTRIADIPDSIEFAKSIDGLTGVIIIKEDQIGLWGDLEIRQIST